MKNMTKKHILFHLIMWPLIAVVTVVACEVFLRFTLPLVFADDHRHYIWPPGFQKIFYASQEVLPGIKGPTRFSTNSLGFRGAEPFRTATKRILCMGGSATECLFLDDKKTWPHLLESCLKNKWNDRHVWVGNLGRSGLNTVDNLLQMKYQLPELPHMDVVILMVGVNDCVMALAGALELAYDRERRFERLFYDVAPRDFRFRPKRKTALGWLGRRIKHNIFDPNYQDSRAAAVSLWRSQRKSASVFINELPDLNGALSIYEKNLENIKKLADSKGLRIIFVTQPTMYRDDLTAEEKGLLWQGYASFGPNRAYFTVAVLAKAMQKYNDVLMEFCRKSGTERIDLASQLPKSTQVFYDDCHFNDNGASLVAAIICKYLVDNAPMRNANQ